MVYLNLRNMGPIIILTAQKMIMEKKRKRKMRRKHKREVDFALQPLLKNEKKKRPKKKKKATNVEKLIYVR